MPKRLSELRDLSIGQRQDLVLKTVREKGPVSVRDILETIVATMSINVTANVKSTLRRSIENDLKSLIGLKGVLDVSYYYKDGITKVPDDKIEEDEKGRIKNKYCLKYYLLGGKSHIPGLGLFEGSSVSVEIPRVLTPSIRVESAYNVKSKNSFSIVVEKNGNEFIAVNFSAEDLPVGFLICRNYKDTEPLQNTAEKFGQRTFRMKINHISVDRNIPEVKDGHAYIKISSRGEIEITDFNTLNGTFVSKVSKNMTDLIFSKKITFPKKQANIIYPPRPPIESDLENMVFDDYYPFHNEFEWNKVNEQIKLSGSGFLVKLGSVIIYIGRSSFIGGQVAA